MLDQLFPYQSDLSSMVVTRFRNKKTLFIALGAVAVLGTTGMVYKYRNPEFLTQNPLAKAKVGLNKNQIALALDSAGAFHDFPGELEMAIDGNRQKVVVQYAFDSKLQEAMENQFRTYRPDYGAFVAIDAATGRVLSMVSYSGKGDIKENLALRATFPSASVFKVVTAAAAIAEQHYKPDTMISFNGRNHTLFRSNIVNAKTTRWTRHMSLREAFAHSVNTVFGRIGAYTVGADRLAHYADRFGFNRKIQTDLPMQEGKAPIQNDPWLLAETASGYTRDNTMSPLQGALIAAAIANDGIMMEPYAIDSIHSTDGQSIYAASPKVSTVAIDSQTAETVKTLMRETVLRGTSRKSFRGFFKREFADLDVGGKTGSLTGMDPPGKYDWFVGYADSGSRRIAVAAVTVHQKLWRVKSSFLARKAIESFFKGRKIQPRGELVQAKPQPDAISPAGGASASSSDGFSRTTYLRTSRSAPLIVSSE